MILLLVKKKWNISILVIFVLLASSLLGVLAMNFIQSMMKQSATVYNYYQSYYLAKAWTELALAELGHRGVGFEQTFSDPNFLTGNFLCAGRCSMSFGLSWTSTNLSQQFWTDELCQSPFSLTKWASLILPVFRDTSDHDLPGNFASGVTYINLFPILDTLQLVVKAWSQKTITFGLLILSWEELASNGIFFRTGSLSDPDLSAFIDDATAYVVKQSIHYTKPDLSERFFFMISNSSSSNISFCLTAQKPLPTQQYYIKSRWTYDRQKLGLEAVYKQPIPDFLLNGYLNF